MANTKYLYGKWCRYYINGYIWVSDDGSMAVAKTNNNYRKLKLKKDKDGLYAIDRFGNRISMANAVMTCYCAPKPQSGKYVIGYKDGDNTNCAKANLYWEECHYQHCYKPSVTAKYYNSKVKIYMDGTVKVDGKDAQIYDYLYDADMDLHDCISPYIHVNDQSIYGKSIFMDDLMKDSGYVNGDDAGMKNPKILHCDNDWMNFSSDNLEWCEEDDPRYKKYTNEKHKAMNLRTIELNPDKKVPDFYLLKVN